MSGNVLNKIHNSPLPNFRVIVLCLIIIKFCVKHISDSDYKRYQHKTVWVDRPL